MAKKKTKVAKRPARKVKPLVVPPAVAWLPAEVVLVPVPVEKTKKSEWQKFVDWIWK